MSATYPAAIDRAPMFRVSLILEALRARPVLMFWVAALAQGALWTLVPSLFYAAPPGEVPLVLAVGNEWVLGSPYGPPLAYWLADIAFRIAGGVLGVYVLSQVCVVATYWAVFTLGRRIVGTAHAAMAVLLMAGISAFTVPTIEFGPTVLAMPLTALTLLFGYRALADNRRGDWIASGVALGLLLLTTYAGLILLALMALFVATTARGRSRLGSIGPWAAALIVVLINIPHLFWLERTGVSPLPMLAALPGLIVAEKRLMAWANLVLLLAFSHAGLVVLMLVAGGFLAGKRASAPAVERLPVEPFAKSFVYFFALAPAFVATLLAVLLGKPAPVGGAAPLVVLSGLAVVVAAGDMIRLYRQRISALVWLGLLLVPAGRDRCRDRDAAVDRRGRSGSEQARERDGAVLHRNVPPPHRQAARDRDWRCAHRRACRARVTGPAKPLCRRRACARALALRRGGAREGRNPDLDRDRCGGHAAGCAQGALPRHGCRSAALVRPLGAGAVAAVAHRLGGDPAALIFCALSAARWPRDSASPISRRPAWHRSR